MDGLYWIFLFFFVYVSVMFMRSDVHPWTDPKNADFVLIVSRRKNIWIPVDGFFIFVRPFLYILMGLSIFFWFKNGNQSNPDYDAVFAMWCVNLFLNKIWIDTFFITNNLRVGAALLFIDALLLDGSALYVLIEFGMAKEWQSFGLYLVYSVWLVFATWFSFRVLLASLTSPLSVLKESNIGNRKKSGLFKGEA